MSTDGSQEERVRHGQVIKSHFEIIFMRVGPRHQRELEANRVKGEDIFCDGTHLEGRFSSPCVSATSLCDTNIANSSYNFILTFPDFCVSVYLIHFLSFHTLLYILSVYVKHYGRSNLPKGSAQCHRCKNIYLMIQNHNVSN